jgi:hypothetical protein
MDIHGDTKRDNVTYCQTMRMPIREKNFCSNFNMIGCGGSSPRMHHLFRARAYRPDAEGVRQGIKILILTANDVL